MKKILILGIATPAALAAGWWLRGVLEAPVVADATVVAVVEAEPAPPLSPAEEVPDEAVEVVEVVERERTALDALPTSYEDRLAMYNALDYDRTMENEVQLKRMIQGMSASELKAMIKNDPMNPNAGMLISRWVELDSNGVFAYMNEEKPGDYAFNQRLFSYWARTNPDQAMSKIKQMKGNARSNAMSNFISQLANVDPDKALKLVEENDLGRRSTWQYSNIARAWTREDPQAALAAIEGLPSGAGKRRAWQGYFGELAREDPQGALDQVMLLDDQKAINDSMASIYQSWFSKDFETAFSSLGEVESMNVRAEILQNSTWRLANEGIEDLPGRISELLDGRWQDNFTRNYISNLARRDPEGARDFVEEMPFGQGYRDGVRNLVQQWGETQPMEALAWVQSLPPGEERDSGLNQAIYKLAEHQPQLALNQFLTLSEHDQDGNNIRQLANGLVRYDPELAATLIQGVAKEEIRNELQDKMIDNWARKDPIAALDYLNENGLELDGNKARNIANGWAQENPAEAADWALTLEGQAQERAVQTVADSWLRHDSYEASIWIADLPEGKTRDNAVRSLVSNTRQYDPKTAFDWTQDIGDEKMRYREADYSLREWIRDDPKAAEAAESALLKSELPQEEIDKLVEKHFKK